MTKLVEALLVVCVAGLVGAGCSSENSAASPDAGNTGSGGNAVGSGGSSSGSGGSGGAAGGTGGSAGGGLDAGSGSGGVAGATDAGGTAGSGGAGGSGGAADAGGTEVAPVPPADTWENYAKGFAETFCVSCHNDDRAGDATRDYHMLAVVVREKVDIACGTAKSAAARATLNCPGGAPVARQFPPGNGAKPTDEQRDRFLRWIAAGTP
jgi:hypothetical protein